MQPLQTLMMKQAKVITFSQTTFGAKFKDRSKGQTIVHVNPDQSHSQGRHRANEAKGQGQDQFLTQLLVSQSLSKSKIPAN